MTDEQIKSEALRLRPMLVRVAYSYLKEREEAEDVAQDVLLKLWQLRDQLQMPVEGLARVLAHNLCIDRCRHRQYMESLDAATDQTDLDDSAERERIERMMAVVKTLPDLQQTILRLRHVDGMEMSDIAALMGTSEVNVRKMLSRARLAIKNQLIKPLHNGKD
jgi:RNA polymerase sigma-70 factor (ECF subfamily)